MTNPDLDRLIKVGIEAGLAANAAHYLSEGRHRPTRVGGYEGGLIPDPQHYNTREQVQFVVAGLTIRWVLFHLLIIPFLVMWGALMGGVAAAIADHGGPLHWYGITWLAVSGLVGLRILWWIHRRVDGRRSTW